MEVGFHTEAAPERGTVYVEKTAQCRHCKRTIKMESRGGTEETLARWLHYDTNLVECRR
jgi:hypothetical protein